MMEEPHYNFHNDSQALSVIAENGRKMVILLESIRNLLSYLIIGLAGLAGALWHKGIIW
jgi:hypothetical protein